MADHLIYIGNTKDMYVLINYSIYTISNSFTIFNNNYCNSHKYHKYFTLVIELHLLQTLTMVSVIY